MNYFRYQGHTLASEEALPYEPLAALPGEGEVLWCFRRPPLAGRETFAVPHPDLLTAREGVEALTTLGHGPNALPPELAAAVAAGRVRAVNLDHPRWEALLDPGFPVGPPREKVRVHLLALGDVGSTLAIGLRLMGGDVLSSIGVCDVREGVARRWEFELNQIGFPGQYDTLPPVEEVDPARIFDCDVFLFCASRFVPDTAVKTGDVRMAQYEVNRELVVQYARKAREAKFQGLFCVVSDPVDPLCRAALTESNKDETGTFDGQGLTTRQVRGFGLGVMNARAAYYAKRDPRFAAFLTEGRSFGPHGNGLVIANSIDHYDDAISRELTARTVHANLEMREMGFKPYVAPALSSGALSLLLCLRGQWHCSSVYLGGVFMGVKNRLSGDVAVEQLPLPEALYRRLQNTARDLSEIL